MSTTSTLLAGAPTARVGAVWQLLLQAVASRLGRSSASAEKSAAIKTARELAAVRALADRYRRSDPGFASDLYAAAARYESSLDHKA